MKALEQLLLVNNTIEKNLQIEIQDAGFLAQNILIQLRNLVEASIVLHYMNNAEYSYDNIPSAIELAYRDSSNKFIHQFHPLLQKTTSHYTKTEEHSLRLMLKYYEYLLNLKAFMKQEHKVDILDKLSNFPFGQDETYQKFYEEVVKILPYALSSIAVEKTFQYYIHSMKPFFVGEEIYYEVTLESATAFGNKQDRVIAFTKEKLLDNYAVSVTLIETDIYIYNRNIHIFFIKNWKVAIRACEIKNLLKIFGVNEKCNTSCLDYTSVLGYLKVSHSNLLDIVDMTDTEYVHFKQAYSIVPNSLIFRLLDLGRRWRFLNIIRYFFYKTRNTVIKKQQNDEANGYLSNLYLQYGCIPFENMPFCSSLIGHNPSLYDLFQCISLNERTHELLVRKLKNRLEVDGFIYTSEQELQNYCDLADIKKLTQIFNSKIYYKHKNRLVKFRNTHYLHFKYAEDDAVQIITKLRNYSINGAENYVTQWDEWCSNSPANEISEEKKNILANLYGDSQVAMIYGAAGTGKSTVIGYFSQFTRDKIRIYLANTNAAVNNLKTKVGTKGDCEFFTVAKFISNTCINRECFLLVVDECSTISNNDMNKVLQMASFNYLMLVGDVYQIQSIHFGNWFEIARKFLPLTSHHELTTSYRASNKNLQLFWDSVRNLDNDILEKLVNFQISSPLDEFSFQKESEDEVLLCMHYDGLYGINNINYILQESNPNRACYFGIQRYKVGDPVIFKENSQFSPILYNNLKGIIIAIKQDVGYIEFDVKIEQKYAETECEDINLLSWVSNNGDFTVVRITVLEPFGSDEESEESRIPFQVCYAMSIHKAQGLEFDSVKIILTNEERITSNIFYTAVTRAKSKLKIYWSKETEKKVIDQLEGRPDLGKDIAFLRQAMTEREKILSN